MKQVAVVIPFYKNKLSEYEKIALQQCLKVLSAHPIIAIKPQSLTLPNEANSIAFAEVVNFDNRYFKDIAGYNRLMLSSEFYDRFGGYKHILICQLDTFVFKDELSYWCNQGFDYIGAPWIQKTYDKSIVSLFAYNFGRYISKLFRSDEKANTVKYQLKDKVGNGGFSLRKVQKFRDICISSRQVIDQYLAKTDHYHNEDVFWSIEVNKHQPVLTIPNCKTGLKFAFEVPPIKPEQFNDQTRPFGCHDWDKYASYWRPIFKLYGYEI